jgi:hypothetical protein
MAIDRDELLSQRGRLPSIKTKTSVQTVGGRSSATERNTLAFDVETTSVEDIRWFLRSLALDEIGQQYDIGNVASRVIVDGKFTKDILRAQRKIEVLFGIELERKAMELIEAVLQQAIDTYTNRREGRLRDVKSNWEWVYAPTYSEPAVPVNLDNIKMMVPGSMLVLRPRVDHAGIANVVPKAGQYMDLVDKMLRRRRPLANFRVATGVSRKFQVEGERSFLGTPFIRLTVKGRI